MNNPLVTKPQIKRILLGEISGVHGIKGHVLVRTYSAEPAGIAAYGALENETRDKTFTLKIIRATDKGVVASIAGVADRSAAEGLRGTKLYVERHKLPKASADEYYHADLIGLKAIDGSGETIGEIISVQNYGAGDLLEIKRSGAAQTDLIPLTNASVPEIDIEQGIAVINPPDLIETGDSGARDQDE